MVGTTQTEAAQPKGWRERIIVPGLETNTGLAAFEGIILMILACVLAGSSGAAGDAVTPVTVVALVLGIFGWMLFQFARLTRIFQRQAEDGPQKLADERRRLMLSEMYVWLFVSLITLSAIVLAQREIGGFGFLRLGAPVGLITFMMLLGSAFMPTAVGVLHTERKLAVARVDGKILRKDAISTGSLLVALIAMVVIVTIAWLAAHESLVTLGENAGVIATLFVMFAFLFFIVLSSVTRGLNLFDERDRTPAIAASFLPAAPLATIASWVDSILVRILAPMTGAVQAPDGRHGLGWHHAFIIGVMAPLTLLGYGLPQPWGLVPIALAFLFALAIGRRWAWVEGDREAASRLRTTKGPDIHVGFANDLRDEALLGYSFLFVLVPLTLYQLNEMTGAFCLRGLEVNGHTSCRDGQGTFRDWIGFFGLELFKAVPLVDWAEIYGLESRPNIVPVENDDLAKHLVFGARVLVDFVVMAALFQAISIFQRNHTQRKLYDSGQLDVLDPITEEDFFETGMVKVGKAQFDAWNALPPAEKKKNPVVELGHDLHFTAKQSFLDRVENHVALQRSTGADRPYDNERLDQLVDDDRLDLRAGAMWMVEKYGLLAGSPRHRLRTIDFRNRIMATESAENMETSAEITERVSQTNRVLADASRESADVGDEDIGSFLRLAASVADIPVSQIALKSLLERLRSENALFVLKLMAQSTPATHPELEVRLGLGCGNLKLGSSLAGIRASVYGSIATLAQNAAAEGTTASTVIARDALAFCESKARLQISGGDRAVLGQRAAKAAAKTIQAALCLPESNEA